MNVRQRAKGHQRVLAHLIIGTAACFGAFTTSAVGAATTSMDTVPSAQATNDDIVRAVRMRLAAFKLDSVTELDVAADANGTVRLTGKAATQEAADRAIEAARNAEGVEFVKSDIVVVRDLH
jgi:osmotically-inducible protein OsmY